ncbi:MAG: ABC transporter substrate-binding protein [Pseudomonadota bacterium]
MKLLMPVTLAAAMAATTLLAEPYTVTDGLGVEHTFDAPPERVVAIYNDAYGQVATLGFVPSAVLANPEMIKDTETYLAEGPDIDWVGGDPWWEIDAELVAANKPDLIIAWGQDHVDTLSSIAPVFAMDGLAGDDGRGAYNNLRAIAKVVGMEDEAEAQIAAFDARVAAYAALVPDQPTILKLSHTGEGSFAFASSGDPVCPLLDRIVTCQWQDPTGEGGWGYDGTLEQALAIDPDIIILNNWDDSLSSEEFMAMMEANPLYGELSAVKNNSILHDPDYHNPIFSSIAAGTVLVDTILPRAFPATFPNGALTDAEVAAAVN